MNYSDHNNKKRAKRHRSHGKKVKNKAGFIIARVFIAAFLIGIFALAGAGIGAYLGVIQASPDLPATLDGLLIETLDSVMLDANGNEFARLDAGENREFVSIDRIPQHVLDAFVAIEDERFFEHNGVDTRGLVRAVYQNLFHSSLQGGSTLTQQLIKNARNLPRNSIESKLQEQYMAVRFEQQLTETLGSREAAKMYILESYVNMVALGHGQNGVQAAARYYFDKDVSELTLSEGAVLAAMLPNPTRFSPVRFPNNNRMRQEAVIDKMLELELISEAEHYYALNDDVYARILQVSEEFREQGNVRSYFEDAVIDRLMIDLQAMGFTTQDASRLIFSGGLIIETTKDPEIQRILDETFLDESLFPTHPDDFFYFVEYRVSIRNRITEITRHRSIDSRRWEALRRFVRTEEQIDEFVEWARGELLGPDDVIAAEVVFYSPQPQASMIIIDHNTGHVVGMAGGRGEKQTDRSLNRATHSTRQPGSVFKILAAYAPAFDMGLITAATTFDDSPNIIRDWSTGRDIVWPQNWYSGFRGFNHVRRSIEWSYNVIAVKALDYAGVDNAFNYLQRFGFTTLVEQDRVSAIALGGLTHGVTNMEVTAAFGAIANGGMLNSPILYTRVLNSRGDVLIENSYEPRQVLNRNSAYLLTDTMRGVLTVGNATGGRLRNTRMDTAGKTGTTQEARDQYFVGYTPYFTAGVWIGYDHPRPMSQRITGAGGRQDTTIWRHVMEQVHEGLEFRQFERPPGFTTVTVCTVSGKLPMPGVCSLDPRGLQTRTEIFAPGTEPTTYCDIHLAYTVCRSSGRIPNSFCPPSTVSRGAGITRDRSFVAVSGNVSISDAAFEVPQGVLHGLICDVHSFSNQGETENPDDQENLTVDTDNENPDGTDEANTQELPTEQQPEATAPPATPQPETQPPLIQTTPTPTPTEPPINQPPLMTPTPANTEPTEYRPPIALPTPPVTN
ncbi:MAG: transglycosylase domain-containing protein [Defluviitaleaceae bacterium]|nr:transglycosylase domain-containing protein [Defluviitaleaceae bacterium]